MSETDLSNHPFADRRVRTLIGLGGGMTIAVVAVLFVEPPLQWLMLGIAALDVVVTPYILGMAIEEKEAEQSPEWSGD